MVYIRTIICVCVIYILKTETACSSGGSSLTYQPKRQYVLEDRIHRLFTGNLYRTIGMERNEQKRQRRKENPRIKTAGTKRIYIDLAG